MNSDEYDEDFQRFRRAAHRLPITLVSSSKFVLQRFSQFGREARYVPAALSDVFFNRREARLSDAEPRVLLATSDRNPEKGLADAAAALVSVRRRHKIRVVWITPDSPLDPSVADEIHVAVSPQKVRNLMCRSDVLVYTPRVDGLGLPPLEAMASGCAVVVTDCGGPSEFCVDGVNSVIVPKSDVESIAEAICNLIENPGLRMRLAAAGQTTVERYRRSTVSQQLDETLRATRAVPGLSEIIRT